MKARALRSAASAMLLAVAAAACASAGAKGICPQEDRTIEVPSTLGGLAVHDSKKATTKYLDEAEKSQTYVCDANVLEVRTGTKADDELIAVFQVVRLTEDARVDDIKFLQRVAQEIVGSSNLPDEVSDRFVWRGEHNKQQVYVWFQGYFMEVLVVRQTTQSGQTVDASSVLDDALALESTAA